MIAWKEFLIFILVLYFKTMFSFSAPVIRANFLTLAQMLFHQHLCIAYMSTNHHYQLSPIIP